LQRYEDHVHSNKTINDIVGANIFGNFKKFSVNIDGFIQHTDPEGSSKTTNRVVNANFVYPLKKNINSRLGISVTDSTDDSFSKQFNLGFDFFNKLSSTTNLTLSPYVQYRKTDYTTSEQREYGAGFMVALNGQNQGFNSNVAYNFQDIENAPNITNINYGLRYHYRVSKNVFSVEFTGIYRDPNNGEMTNSYKIALIWRYYFSKNFKHKKPAKTVSVEQIGTKRLSPEIFSLLQLNLPVSEITDLISSYKIGNFITQGNYLIYEVKMFEEIEKRQRFVIVEKDGKSVKAAVIFNSFSNNNDILRVLKKVNEEIMKYYGSPATFYEEGNLTDNIVNDLRDGTFSRIYEWYLGNGILRVGIPARLDNQVRVEVQFAKDFPPYNYNYWSLEDIK